MAIFRDLHERVEWAGRPVFALHGEHDDVRLLGVEPTRGIEDLLAESGECGLIGVQAKACGETVGDQRVLQELDRERREECATLRTFSAAAEDARSVRT